MPKKKITVVDIKDNETADIVDINDTPINDDKVIEIDEIKPDTDIPPQEDKVLENNVEIPTDKITRTNELIKCPKCMKMVTNKTLKYSHRKTCSGEEEKQEPVKNEDYNQRNVAQVRNQEPVKQRIQTKIRDIEETPKMIRAISEPQQQILITPEMMRELRNQQRTERLQIRSDKMSSLFTNSI
jgi:hypothetical protein